MIIADKSYPAAGWMIVHPDGSVITAAANKDDAAARIGKTAVELVEGTPDQKPATYTAYPCNQDIVDYFRLIAATPIPWADIDFVDGIAQLRIKRGGRTAYAYRSINLHPHAYHRIRTIARGGVMASLVDEMVDAYIATHPDLLMD